MRFEKTHVFNLENAIYGMRNPMNSHDRYDTSYDYNSKTRRMTFTLGENDKILAQKLIQAGSEHRKFMRQIFVSVEITAPSYFMAELDTYKVGVVRNSSSFQHKGTSKAFDISDFEIDNVASKYALTSNSLNELIDVLNNLRIKYLKTNDYMYFRMIRQLLPMSYRYKSMITMNYENILNMIQQRKNHRLTEWSHDFIEWAKGLPCSSELLFFNGGNDERLGR